MRLFKSFTITGAEIDEEELREFADTRFYHVLMDLLRSRMKSHTEELANALTGHDKIVERMKELRDLIYQLESYAPDPS